MKTPEERRAYIHAWQVADRKKHPEKWRAIYRKNARRFRAANLEKVRATVRAHAEYIRDWSRRDYAANPDKYREIRRAKAGYLREWRRADRKCNPEKYRAMNVAERARRLGNAGVFTVVEWREKLALFAYCCAYCGESKPLTVDHKIPLIRGGTNDIMNVVPACQSCNSKKGRLTATEFLARGRVA